jgi:hypothetical protein
MARAPSSHSLVFARNMPTSDQSLDDFRLHLETTSSSCSERACPSHGSQIVSQVCLSRKQHPSCVLSLSDPQTPPHLCSESVCPTDSTQLVFRGYLSHKHHPTCVRSAPILRRVRQIAHHHSTANQWVFCCLTPFRTEPTPSQRSSVWIG